MEPLHPSMRKTNLSKPISNLPTKHNSSKIWRLNLTVSRLLSKLLAPPKTLKYPGNFWKISKGSLMSSRTLTPMPSSRKLPNASKSNQSVHFQNEKSPQTKKKLELQRHESPDLGHLQILRTAIHQHVRSAIPRLVLEISVFSDSRNQP